MIFFLENQSIWDVKIKVLRRNLAQPIFYSKCSLFILFSRNETVAERVAKKAQKLENHIWNLKNETFARIGMLVKKFTLFQKMKLFLLHSYEIMAKLIHKCLLWKIMPRPKLIVLLWDLNFSKCFIFSIQPSFNHLTFIMLCYYILKNLLSALEIKCVLKICLINYAMSKKNQSGKKKLINIMQAYISVCLILKSQACMKVRWKDYWIFPQYPFQTKTFQT